MLYLFRDLNAKFGSSCFVISMSVAIYVVVSKIITLFLYNCETLSTVNQRLQ